MSKLTTFDHVIFFTGALGILCTAFFFAYATYLYRKWLPSVERIMTGQNVFIISWVFAIHAIILFGSIFTWDWHARRREGRLELREKVPRHVRRKFIFAYGIFIFGSISLIGSGIVLEVMGKI